MHNPKMSQLYSKFWLPASKVVANMNMRGILLDKEETVRKAKEAEKLLLEYSTMLDNWASDFVRLRDTGPMNWRSSQQVCSFFHDFKNFPPSPVKGKPDEPTKNRAVGGKVPRTRSGAAVAFFINWANEQKRMLDCDMLKVYLKYCKVNSLHIFLESLPEEVCEIGRLHSCMASRTTTGRMKSSKPNLQNIPTRGDFLHMRRGFVAKEGHSLIVADYSQLEMYVMAHFMIHKFEDRSMYEDICTGDVHTATAFRIWRKDLEKLGATPENIKEVAKVIRGWAKTVNYAVAYGKTPQGLGEQITDMNGNPIGTKKAQDILDLFFNSYRGLNLLFNECHSMAKTYGYVTTLLGRQRPLPFAKSTMKYQVEGALRKAQNTPIQGSAADIVLTAMLKTNVDKNVGIWYNQKLHELGCNLVLQVHDELVYEVPTENAKEAEKEVVRCMENPFVEPLKVQLKVDSDIGKSWGDCK